MIYYKEVQKFRQWWLWVLVGLAALIMLGTYINKFKIYAQNENPEIPLHWLLIIAIFSMAVVAAVAILLYQASLQIEIKNRSLYYKFSPFIRSWRKLNSNEISEYSIRKYSAIKEFGGWGYRFSFSNGRALTVKGKYGLQLTYGKNKKLLIGTQQPEKLEKSMNELMKKEEDYG